MLLKINHLFRNDLFDPFVCDAVRDFVLEEKHFTHCIFRIEVWEIMQPVEMVGKSLKQEAGFFVECIHFITVLVLLYDSEVPGIKHSEMVHSQNHAIHTKILQNNV